MVVDVWCSLGAAKHQISLVLLHILTYLSNTLFVRSLA